MYISMSHISMSMNIHISYIRVCTYIHLVYLFVCLFYHTHHNYQPFRLVQMGTGKTVSWQCRDSSFFGFREEKTLSPKRHHHIEQRWGLPVYFICLNNVSTCIFFAFAGPPANFNIHWFASGNTPCNSFTVTPFTFNFLPDAANVCVCIVGSPFKR